MYAKYKAIAWFFFGFSLAFLLCVVLCLDRLSDTVGICIFLLKADLEVRASRKKEESS